MPPYFLSFPESRLVPPLVRVLCRRVRARKPDEFIDHPPVLRSRRETHRSIGAGKAVRIGHSCAAVTGNEPKPRVRGGKANLRLNRR